MDVINSHSLHVSWFEGAGWEVCFQVGSLFSNLRDWAVMLIKLPGFAHFPKGKRHAWRPLEKLYGSYVKGLADYIFLRGEKTYDCHSSRLSPFPCGWTISEGCFLAGEFSGKWEHCLLKHLRNSIFGSLSTLLLLVVGEKTNNVS